MIARLIKIYQDNEATYYDYSTGVRQPTSGRKVSLLILAAIMAACMDKPVDSFVSLIITVQAILIGFSFSVMFFLVGERQKVQEFSGSREERLRKKQLSNLSKEIFWNISYFNVASLIGIAAAICLIIKNPIFLIIHSMNASGFGMQINSQHISLASAATFAFGKFIFAAVLIDSAYSFVRIVGRVNFLFEKRMEVTS